MEKWLSLSVKEWDAWIPFLAPSSQQRIGVYSPGRVSEYLWSAISIAALFIITKCLPVIGVLPKKYYSATKGIKLLIHTTWDKSQKNDNIQKKPDKIIHIVWVH